MQSTSYLYAKRLVSILFILSLFLPAAAGAGEYQEQVRVQTDHLTLVNLVGEVRLEPATGSDFEADIAIRGRDASPELIEIRQESRGRLILQFPTRKHHEYVYPKMGRGTKTRIHGDPAHSGHGIGNFLRFISGRGIEVKGDGSGLEIWADVTLRVPEGRQVSVVQGVGSILAEGMEADLDLDIDSGSIQAKNLNGSLVLDTGSGSIEAFQIQGNLNADTGSGSVDVVGFNGAHLLVDTGSGSVDLEDCRCERLDVDTGSGHVQARLMSVDEGRIDTGSGSIELDLVQMGHGSFELDAGSGSIHLGLPPGASARIHADTGSGSITTDLNDMRIRHQEDDEIDLTLGNGDARVDLDTGSGSIHIFQ